MLLQLGHDLYWNRPHLYFRSLLAHQSIYHIQHLIAEAGLPYGACACREHKRP